MTRVCHLDHASPVGPLRLAASARGLVAVHLPNQRHMPATPPPTWSAPVAGDAAAARVLDDARRQLDAYFAGRLTTFELPLDADGTAFQRAVWDALAAIPFATTASYAGLARAIGRPGASRAVGLANGRNPIAIVVPCHRVIGADGSMTGYGGGLACKRFLLAHERTTAGIPEAQGLLV